MTSLRGAGDRDTVAALARPTPLPAALSTSPSASTSSLSDSASARERSARYLEQHFTPEGRDALARILHRTLERNGRTPHHE